MWKIADGFLINLSSNVINLRDELYLVTNVAFEEDGDCLLVPEDVVEVIHTYIDADGFAGMSLAEYIDKIYGDLNEQSESVW